MSFKQAQTKQGIRGLVRLLFKAFFFHWLLQSLDQRQKWSEVSMQYLFFRPQDLISRAAWVICLLVPQSSWKISPQNRWFGGQKIHFELNENASFYPKSVVHFLVSDDFFWNPQQCLFNWRNENTSYFLHWHHISELSPKAWIKTPTNLLSGPL